jgi:hypothetical protein
VETKGRCLSKKNEIKKGEKKEQKKSWSRANTETMLQRAASSAYSWWWASHVRTKQSKWLDSNLQGLPFVYNFVFFLLFPR